MSLRDVLPTTWTETAAGAEVGGVPLAAIAERYGTPAYVFDVAHLRDRLEEFDRALDDVGTPVYATKAFWCTAMAELVADTRWWVDVVSLGEAENARRGGIPADRMLLHGNLKIDAELDLGVSGSVGIVVIDSVDELARLDQRARAAQAVVDVMVRLNEDVDLAAHPKVLTSGDEAKFGLLPGDAVAAIGSIENSNHLRLRGVHLHVGSQALDAKLYGVLVERLVAFVDRHRSAFEISPVLLDVGGGMAAPYLRDDRTISVAEVVDAMRSALDRADAANRIGEVELLIEPGRAVVANAGVILYTIGVRKAFPKGGELVAVDGGMTDNPRPVMYGSRYELIPVTQPSAPTDTPFRVFGRMCETDLMLEETYLPSTVGTGDVVAMPAGGAYTYSMSSRYNGLRRPPVLFVEDGIVRQVVRRETVEDVLAGESGLGDSETWSYTRPDE